MHKGSIVIILLCVVLIGCDKKTPLSPQNNEIVIQGYLYANKSINGFKLTSLTKYDLYDQYPAYQPIPDASVTLMKKQQQFSFSYDQGSQSYYYKGTDLQVEPGDTFYLEVNFHDNISTGETVVPQPVQIISFSSDTLCIDKKWDWMEKYKSYNSIEVKWSSENIVNYFIDITYQDSFGKQRHLYPVTWANFLLSDRLTNIPNNTYYLSPGLFDQAAVEGRCCFHITQIDAQYFQLCDSRYNSFYADDPRSLNRVESNIKNGYGIFTAFNEDSMFFYIKRK